MFPFTFRIFILLLSMVSYISASNHTNETNIIDVMGTSKVSIQKDAIQVRLGILSTSTTAAQAQMMTSDKANRVLQTLRTFNVTNLFTESISLMPDYNYTDSPPRIVGFTSSNMISYKASSQIAGQTLDAGIRAGANTIDVTTTTLNEEAMKSAYNQALTKAAQDANEKATTISSAFNLCLGDISKIVVEERMPPPPSPTIMSFNTIESDSRTIPTIVPGEMEITATILVSYQISKCS